MYEKAMYDSDCSRLKVKYLVVIKGNKLKITAVEEQQSAHHRTFIIPNISVIYMRCSYCAAVGEDRDR
jgi:hypothetical protein